MSKESKPYSLDRVVHLVLIAGLIAGLIWLLSYLSDVLIPFAVAVLLAYLINPLVLLVQKMTKNRAVSVFVSLFLVTALGVFFAVLLIPMIAGEIGDMGRGLSMLANDTALAERASKFFPTDFWAALQGFAAKREVQDFFTTVNFWKLVQTVASKALPGVWGLITGTASFIVGLVGLAVIGLYLIFLLLDYPKMSQGWKDLLPTAYRDAVTAFVQEFETAMHRYFRAQAAIALIVGILFATGFGLIGLPMGILLGLFVGLLNMVPYLQIIGIIPAFLLSLVHAVETGSSVWGILVMTGLVFFVVQLIQDMILTPKIMGNVTGLNPAMILLSLSIWGKLLGFFGLIIALPMTCLFLAYYRRFIASTPAEVAPSPQVKE